MLRGYDAGAVDYVFKPFDPMILRSKVSVFVELFEKTHEIEREGGARAAPARGKAAGPGREAGGRAGAAQAEERAGGDPAARCRSASMRARDAAVAALSSARQSSALTGFPPERLRRPTPDFGLGRVHPEDSTAAAGARRARASRRQLLRIPLALRRRQLPHFLDQGVCSPRRRRRARSSARCSTSPSGASSRIS